MMKYRLMKALNNARTPSVWGIDRIGKGIGVNWDK
jgi:hypothetical protein